LVSRSDEICWSEFLITDVPQYGPLQQVSVDGLFPDSPLCDFVSQNQAACTTQAGESRNGGTWENNNHSTIANSASAVAPQQAGAEKSQKQKGLH
jgi:hypothetical protein